MSASAAGKKIVFRHGTFNIHPVLASAALLCLLAVALIAALTLRSWLFVTALCFFALSLYASVVYLKFEIWESGFSFSSLSRRRVFEFAQIADALFETAEVGEGYSSPVFSLRLKGEDERKKVPIGIFPSRAAGLLFTALERHGIQIRHDGSRLVEDSMRQIREVQFTQ